SSLTRQTWCAAACSRPADCERRVELEAGVNTRLRATDVCNTGSDRCEGISVDSECGIAKAFNHVAWTFHVHRPHPRRQAASVRSVALVESLVSRVDEEAAKG